MTDKSGYGRIVAAMQRQARKELDGSQGLSVCIMKTASSFTYCGNVITSDDYNMFESVKDVETAKKLKSGDKVLVFAVSDSEFIILGKVV